MAVDRHYQYRATNKIDFSFSQSNTENSVVRLLESFITLEVEITLLKLLGSYSLNTISKFLFRLNFYKLLTIN